MITAVEALALPCAKLDDKQIASVTKLLEEIGVFTGEHMRRNGFDIKVVEIDYAVIGEVNQRLKRLGWAPVWQKIQEKHPLNKAVMAHIGFLLTLMPSDAAYAEADAIRLS